MLTIIDRFIAKNFLAYFFAGLVVFTTIFLAIDVTSVSMRFQPEGSVLLEYYKYYVPIILNQLIPVGCMIGTLFTLSNLNRNNELIILFSMGMSLARISLPILVMIGLISVFSFGVGDRIIPTLAQKKSYVYYVDLKKRPGQFSTVRKDKIWYRSDNTIFNIKSINPEKSTAQGITLWYFDQAWNLVQLIKANFVVMQDRIWNLEDGTVTLFAEESSFPLTKAFAKKTIMMSEDLADVRAATPNSETLSLAELRRFIQKNKESGLETLGYEVDLHAKISFAFASLILSLVGIPFTVQRSRSGGNMMSIGVSIVSAFVYWVAFSSSLSFGKHGGIPPIVAAWAPNVIISAAAVYLLLRQKK